MMLIPIIEIIKYLLLIFFPAIFSHFLVENIESEFKANICSWTILQHIKSLFLLITLIICLNENKYYNIINNLNNF